MEAKPGDKFPDNLLRTEVKVRIGPSGTYPAESNAALIKFITAMISIKQYETLAVAFIALSLYSGS